MFWALFSAFSYLSCWAHQLICFEKEGFLGILNIISIPEMARSRYQIPIAHRAVLTLSRHHPFQPCLSSSTWPSKKLLKYKVWPEKTNYEARADHTSTHLDVWSGAGHYSMHVNISLYMLCRYKLQAISLSAVPACLLPPHLNKSKTWNLTKTRIPTCSYPRQESQCARALLP